MQFPFSIEPSQEDEKWMLEALKEAWKAFNANEVPIGAVLVKNNQVIARGYNQVEAFNDATAHAEMLCIRSGETVCGNWRLADTTLYTTLEPCSMCAGAILLTRIPVLVWGAPDIRHGANGSWVDLFAKQHPMHTLEIRKGVLANYASTLLQDFFKKQRQREK